MRRADGGGNETSLDNRQDKVEDEIEGVKAKGKREKRSQLGRDSRKKIMTFTRAVKEEVENTDSETVENERDIEIGVVERPHETDVIVETETETKSDV